MERLISLGSAGRRDERQADDARPTVCTDHGTNLTDLDVGSIAVFSQNIQDVVDIGVGGISVHHCNVANGTILCLCVDEKSGKGGECFGTGPLLSGLFDFSGRNIDKRFNREERTKQRLGSADAPPFSKVVESIDCSVHIRPSDEVRATSSRDPPSAATLAAASTMTPWPEVIDWESITVTGRRSTTAIPPKTADWCVAESAAEILIQTTPVAPEAAAARKAASNAPGEGAAVSGRSGAAAIRSQN
jgi:hypothetical protein